ncbi:hypothetical protein ANCCEY_14239 [Ancylostoma ceylanicum]|uniref:Uncharacterized protein n=1 Tax=Ancylostoma ceylanicum TaxID=53326 RepID=A0A0D6LG82_9BILA|nr:hypothetical protein ANCCEY_14239 [Ancylostoma ceylanicum]
MTQFMVALQGSTTQAEKMARNKRAASNCKVYPYGTKPPCYRSPLMWFYQLITNKDEALSFCAGNYNKKYITESINKIEGEIHRKLLSGEFAVVYNGPCPCTCSSLCEERSNFTRSQACPGKEKVNTIIYDLGATTETNATPRIVVPTTSISKKYSPSEDTMETTTQQNIADSIASESPTQWYPPTTNSDKIEGSSSLSHPSGATAFASSQQGDKLTKLPVVEFPSGNEDGNREFTSSEVGDTLSTPLISSDDTPHKTSTTSKESDGSFTTAAFNETVPSTDSMHTSVREKERESTKFHLTEETTTTELSVQGRSTEASPVSTTWMGSSAATPSTDAHTSQEATLTTTESSSESSNTAAASSMRPSAVTSRNVVGTSKTSSASVKFYKSTNPSDGATISASTLPNVSRTTLKTEHSSAPQDDVTSPIDPPLTPATAEVGFEAISPGNSGTSEGGNSQLIVQTQSTPKSLLYSTIKFTSSATIPEVTTTATTSRKWTSTYHNYQASTETIVPTGQNTPLSIENSEATMSREQMTSTNSSLSTIPLSTKLVNTTTTKFNGTSDIEAKRPTTEMSGYDTVDTSSSRQWPTSITTEEQPWFAPNLTEKYSSTLTPSEGYSWSTSQLIPGKMSSSKQGSTSTAMTLSSEQQIYSTKEKEMYPGLDSSLMTQEIYISTPAQSRNEQTSVGTISRANGGRRNTTVTQSITDHMDMITSFPEKCRRPCPSSYEEGPDYCYRILTAKESSTYKRIVKSKREDGTGWSRFGPLGEDDEAARVKVGGVGQNKFPKTVLCSWWNTSRILR